MYGSIGKPCVHVGAQRRLKPNPPHRPQLLPCPLSFSLLGCGRAGGRPVPSCCPTEAERVHLSRSQVLRLRGGGHRVRCSCCSLARSWISCSWGISQVISPRRAACSAGLFICWGKDQADLAGVGPVAPKCLLGADKGGLVLIHPPSLPPAAPMFRKK